MAAGMNRPGPRDRQRPQPPQPLQPPQAPRDVAAPAAARSRPWFLAIFAVALLVRLAVVAQLQRSVFAEVLVGDGHFYDHWARQLAGGDWVGREPNFLTPGYAYFLAALYALFGAHWLTVRVVHAVLGALTAVLVADAGTRLFNRRAGLL